MSSQVRERMTSFLRNDLNIHCTEISKDQWLSLPLSPVYRFGWMPPVNLQDPVLDDQLIVMFSPDLLAEVLALVSEADANTYLTAVEVIISHYVTNRKVDMEAVERDLDTLFFDQAPRALTVRSEVEFRALSAGIVPTN